MTKYREIIRLTGMVFSQRNIMSSALSIMSKFKGNERFISVAFFVTLATVFRDTP